MEKPCAMLLFEGFDYLGVKSRFLNRLIGDASRCSQGDS